MSLKPRYIRQDGFSGANQYGPYGEGGFATRAKEHLAREPGERIPYPGGRGLPLRDAIHMSKFMAYTPGNEAIADRVEKFDPAKESAHTVAISDLHATQPGVRKRNLEYVIDHPEAGSSTPPRAVRVNGQLYLVDGHHRVVAAAMGGATHVTVQVSDL